MKGREIQIEPLPWDGHVAGLIIDGKLEELAFDPPQAATHPLPGAIYLARVDRPMKGAGGVFVDLGNKQNGFLKSTRPPAPGTQVLVQVTTIAEHHKAPPVTQKLLLKGLSAILTPAAPGINVARSIRDADMRDTLRQIGAEGLARLPDGPGLILRTISAQMSDEALHEDIARLIAHWQDICERAESGQIGCLAPAPGARDIAFREWNSPDTVITEPKRGRETGLFDLIDPLRMSEVAMGAWDMCIEPTRAMVTVDVNTAGDTSPAAGLKANLAAIAELPRQLRLRGLGGQITLDLAPFPRQDRKRLEAALVKALRQDGIDTSIAGWTPMGHLELQRKRARLPTETLFAHLDQRDQQVKTNV